MSKSEDNIQGVENRTYDMSNRDDAEIVNNALQHLDPGCIPILESELAQRELFKSWYDICFQIGHLIQENYKKHKHKTKQTELAYNILNNALHNVCDFMAMFARVEDCEDDCGTR